MQLSLDLRYCHCGRAGYFCPANNIPVTVTQPLGFDGSLALLLLLALGLGVLVAGLVSSPAVIRRQWAVSRLTRQVGDLESRLAEQGLPTLNWRRILRQERAARPQLKLM